MMSPVADAASQQWHSAGGRRTGSQAHEGVYGRRRASEEGEHEKDEDGSGWGVGVDPPAPPVALAAVEDRTSFVSAATAVLLAVYRSVVAGA